MLERMRQLLPKILGEREIYGCNSAHLEIVSPVVLSSSGAAAWTGTFAELKKLLLSCPAKTAWYQLHSECHGYHVGCQNFVLHVIPCNGGFLAL